MSKSGRASRNTGAITQDGNLFISPGTLKARSLSEQPEVMLSARFEKRLLDYAHDLHNKLLQTVKERGALGELKQMLRLFWGLVSKEDERRLLEMILPRGNVPGVVNVIWQVAQKPDAARIAEIAEPLQKCTGDLIARMKKKHDKGQWEYKLRVEATALKYLSKMHRLLLEGKLVEFAEYYKVTLAEKAGKGNVAAQVIIADAELQKIANSALESLDTIGSGQMPSGKS